MGFPAALSLAGVRVSGCLTAARLLSFLQGLMASCLAGMAVITPNFSGTRTVPVIRVWLLPPAQDKTMSMALISDGRKLMCGIRPFTRSICLLQTIQYLVNILLIISRLSAIIFS